MEEKFDAAVVGIGRLGLCFALTLERAGLSVVGIDVNKDYVDSLNSKSYDTAEPFVSQYLKESSQFNATTDLRAVVNAHLIFILVATPTSGGNQFYDHSHLSALLFKLNSLGLHDQHIIISSTVMPGYIRNVGKNLMSDCKCTLSYNPAFVAQGDIMDGYRTGGWFGMVLVGAQSTEIADILRGLYAKICNGSSVNICVMSPESAEICKLASNCFRTTKISFANMIGDIADRTAGANKFDICSALGMDSSIGPKCMMPGFGYGGPCYPRDNRALSQYAQSIGISPCIPSASDAYNDFHHDLMAEGLLKTGLHHILTDVCYKPGIKVPMIDDSPKLAVALRVQQRGGSVVIRDRLSVINEVKKMYGNLFEYDILDLDK